MPMLKPALLFLSGGGHARILIAFFLIDIGLSIGLASAFTIVMIFVGTHAVRRVKQPVSDLRINHSLLILALALCFGLAAVASLIGIAGIVGAFLAGMAFSETTEGTELVSQSQTLTEVMVVATTLISPVFIKPAFSRELDTSRALEYARVSEY